MIKTLAIIGSGDLGQQIAHYAISDNHYGRVVFIDDFAKQSSINAIAIIGTTKDIVDLYKNKLFDELIIGVGYKHLLKRKQLFEVFSKIIPFGTIIHSSSWVDESSVIKAGCVIYPSCSLDSNSFIEENTIINIGCTIAHDTIIGAHSFLSPRVALAGFVKVDELCVLGINSTIIDNLKISSGTQLGGGTVLIKDVLDSGLYVGNPARKIR